MDNYTVEIERFGSLDVSTQELDKFQWKRIDDSHFLISADHVQYLVTLESYDRSTRQMTIVLNQKRFNLKVSNKLDLLIDQMGYAEGMNKGFSDLKAPMPGLVLEIKVNEGEEVAEGQAMIVLEAMKMENIIKAPGPGVVDKILVDNSKTVQKNDTLIKMK